MTHLTRHRMNSSPGLKWSIVQARYARPLRGRIPIGVSLFRDTASTIEIPPGNSAEQVILLGDLFDIGKPGIYRAMVALVDPETNRRIESNPVSRSRTHHLHVHLQSNLTEPPDSAGKPIASTPTENPRRSLRRTGLSRLRSRPRKSLSRPERTDLSLQRSPRSFFHP